MSTESGASAAFLEGPVARGFRTGALAAGCSTPVLSWGLRGFEREPGGRFFSGILSTIPGALQKHEFIMR
jgi:hypothetical protein